MALNVDMRVYELISKQFGVDVKHLCSETNLIFDLGASSLQTIELVIELEEEFNISISDEVLSELTTVNDHIDCVRKLLHKRSS